MIPPLFWVSLGLLRNSLAKLLHAVDPNQRPRELLKVMVLSDWIYSDTAMSLPLRPSSSGGLAMLLTTPVVMVLDRARVKGKPILVLSSRSSVEVDK